MYEITYHSSEKFWTIGLENSEIDFQLPGTNEEPDQSCLELAKEVIKNIAKLEEQAISFMKSVCKDQSGWDLSGGEILKNDPWDADYYLQFFIMDYVVFYVGFRNHQPSYVLQRIQ